MRRTFLALTVGLVLVTLGCSSSDETSTPSSTTTSSVVVSAANQPTCDAIQTYNDAFDSVEPPDAEAPVEESAATIQTFVKTLVAPLEAVQSNGPPELQEPVAVLITSANDAAAMDPTDPTDASNIVRMVMAPSTEVTDARQSIDSWTKENCGVTIR